MNASSWQAVWLLAVEVAAVVGLTWLIAWRLRSVVWQRTLWQASLIAITGLLVMEFAALTPDFIRKEVQADTPVMEITAEAMAVSTPENAPVEIAATELSITIPAERLVSLEPVAALTPVNQEVALVADRMTVSKETKAEEAVVKSSADEFPLGLALLLLVWMVGSGVLAGRLLVGRFLLLRFCARSRLVADERLGERVQGIARKLGLKQAVQVLETERIQTPVVFGLLRLTIALPVGFAEKFERRQQEAILAHELAHLAARDPLWYLLADALVSVLWWHPLVWVARARLQVTSELAADEACVLAKHGPETLAECLVTIAKEMHGHGALESIGIEGSGFRSRLGQRVERLLKLSADAVSRPAAWRTRLVKAGLPVVLVGVLLVTSGWARKEGALSWSDLQVQSWMVLSGLMEKPEVSAPVKRERMLLAAATTAARTEANVAQSKLDTIKLKKTTFNRMPLDEVVRFLNVESRNQDMAKLGVDFSVEGKFSLGSVGEINLGAVVIDRELPEGVSLRQALDAICVGAENPIQYEEKNGGVVFQAKAIAAPAKPPEPVAGSQRIFNVVQPKLNSIVIPKLQFKGMALSNALEILQREAKAADLEGEGLEIAMDEKMKQALWFKPMFVTIDPPLMNLTLREAIGAVTTAARHGTQAGVTYRTTDKGVRVELLPEQSGWQRVYRMDMARWIGELERVTASKLQPPWDSPAPMTTEQRNVQAQTLRDMVKRQLQEGKVVFSADEKGQQVPAFFINDRSGFVLVKGDLAQLEQVEDLLRPYQLSRAGEQAGGISPAVRTNLPPMNKAEYETALEELLKQRLKGAEFQRRRNEQYFPGVDLVRTRASGVQVKKLEDFVPLKEVATNVLVEVHLAKIPQERLGEFGFQLALAPMDGSTRMTTMPEGLFKLIRENLEKGGPFMQLSKTNFVLPTDGRGWVTGYAGEDYAIVPKAYDDGETVELFVLKARTDDTGRPRGLTSSGFQRLNTSQTKAVMFPQSSGTFEVIYVTAYTTDKEGKKVLANPQGLQKTDPFMLQGSMGAKLRQEIGRIGFANKPLSEVLSLLSTEVNRGRKADDQIYFFLNDKVTGKDGPVAKPGLEDLRITIDPPMENNSIEAVLKAISASTSREVGKGLKHVVTSAGVMWMWNDVNPIAPVFAPASVEANAKTEPTMFTTVFKFDPETFVRGAEKLTGKKASDLTNIRTTEAELVQTMARLLFASEGADMEASPEVGAQVQLTFVDRTGDFFVRAALEDREIILKAVEKAKTAGIREVKSPGDSSNGQTNLFIRIGKVDTNSFFNELEKKTGEKIDLKVEGNAGHGSYSTRNLFRLLQKYFAAAGVYCEVNDPDAGGTRVSFNPVFGDLWVRGTVEEVEIARKLVQPFLTATSPVPNPSVRTNVVPTGRQRNLAKLDQIVLKEVFFDDKPLSEVVIFLTEEARRLDPEKKGVNFIINSNLDDQSGRSQVDSRGLTLTPVPKANRGGVDLENLRIKINPPLKNLRLVDALDAITKVATPPVDGVGLSFMVEDHAVVFRQRVVDPAQLFTRVYKLDTNILMTLLEKETEGKVTPLSTNVTASGQSNVVWTVPTDKSIGPGDKLSVMVRQYLGGQGVNLAAAEAGGVNTQIFFNERTGVLMVRCTRQDLEIIETALENLGAIEKVMRSPKPLGASAPAGTNAVSKLVQEAKQLYELRRLEEAEVKLREAMKLDPANSAAYYYMNLIQEARYSDLARKRDSIVFPGGLPKARDAFPTPNPYVRTNVVRTLTKAQQRIEAKLDQVVIKEVFFDGLPLSEVVRFLREESAKQDPEKVGINFVINSKLDDQPGGDGGKILRDPLGAPLASVPPEDLRVVLVTINPPLKNLTMREMLSAITNATAQVGKHGLAYVVEDFGVTFRQRVIEPPQLFTQVFKIDPAIFAEGLQRVWANSGMPANSSTNLQDMWRDFIRQAGVVVGTNNATATQIFYNDKTGVLMVRASLKDLEVIQSTIEVLNIIPPQVQMIGQYVEMSREAAKALGFNPVDSLRTRVTPAWIDETRLVVDIPTNKNVLVLGADAPPRMRTVSEEKREKLLTDLKAGGYHYHLMNAGEQVTADGRQAQVGFATDFETALVAAGRVENWASHMGVIPSFLARPKVYPDGETIRLDWVACLTQVLGHDNSPTSFRNPVMAKDPVPKFRVRYSSSTTLLKNGETLMVEGGLVEKNGDTWVTVLMLTPHIVDSTGNRMK